MPRATSRATSRPNEEFWITPGHLEVQNNVLHIGGLDAVKLYQRYAKQTGERRFFVINFARFTENLKRYQNAFEQAAWQAEYKGPLSFHYAAKAYTDVRNPYSLYKVRMAGWGVDAASLNEVELAERVGIPPEKIILTRAGKSEEELKSSVGRCLLNLDSLEEAESLVYILDRRKPSKHVPVSFRINVPVDPKTHPKIATGTKKSNLGVPMRAAEEAYEIVSRSSHIDASYIHTHIGSQILDPSGFAEATHKILGLRRSLADKGHRIDTVGLGGGEGVYYSPQDAATGTTIGDFARAIMGAAAVEAERVYVTSGGRYLKPFPRIWFEPGRWPSADTGILIAPVTQIKQEHLVRPKVFIQSGFNDNPRPMAYDSYHHAVVANRVRPTKAGRDLVDICGRMCESDDTLARERKLPKMERGDLVALLGATAYAIDMQMFQYNQDYMPGQIFIDDVPNQRKKVAWLGVRPVKLEDVLGDVRGPHVDHRMRRRGEREIPLWAD